MMEIQQALHAAFPLVGDRLSETTQHEDSPRQALETRTEGLTEPSGGSAMQDNTTSLYQYFDKTGLLLYVGITSRGITRNREHNRDKIWWPYVHRQTVTHYATRQACLAAERQMIQERRPPFNTQHNPDGHELADFYIRWANAVEGGARPGKIMHDTRGRLPLVLDRGEVQSVAKTLPEHVHLATRVLVPPKFWLQHKGRRAYCVAHKRDAFGLTLTMQGAWLSEFSYVAAVVTRSAGAYELRKLEVTPPPTRVWKAESVEVLR